MATKSKTSATSADTGPALADFEKSLNELEKVVEELEAGDIGLEESLRKFERGVGLARGCQQVLKEAELRVEQLIERDGETSVSPFEE